MTKDLLDCINDGSFDPETQIQPAVSPELLQEIIHEQRVELKRLQAEVKKKQELLCQWEGNTSNILQQEAPSAKESLPESLKRYIRRHDKEELPFPFPWPSLSEKLNGGLWPGLYVLVGNTGSGKSQWALQVSLHAAKQGHPVLYIALELGKDDLNARLLGLMTDIKWSRIWLGRDTDELERAIEAANQLANLPYHQALVSPYGWSYDKLWTLSKAITEHYKRPPLVIVDFLQLVSSPPEIRHEDLRQRMQRTSYAARAIARELNAAVLLISSTSRDNYGRLAEAQVNQPGTAAALVGLGKESGEIEYAADTVLVMARESSNSQASSLDSTIHVGIAKCRAAKAGDWVPLQFNGSSFCEPSSQGYYSL